MVANPPAASARPRCSRMVWNCRRAPGRVRPSGVTPNHQPSADGQRDESVEAKHTETGPGTERPPSPPDDDHGAHGVADLDRKEGQDRMTDRGWRSEEHTSELQSLR